MCFNCNETLDEIKEKGHSMLGIFYEYVKKLTFRIFLVIQNNGRAQVNAIKLKIKYKKVFYLTQYFLIIISNFKLYTFIYRVSHVILNDY